MDAATQMYELHLHLTLIIPDGRLRAPGSLSLRARPASWMDGSRRTGLRAGEGPAELTASRVLALRWLLAAYCRRSHFRPVLRPPREGRRHLLTFERIAFKITS
jgi:hypothetical protein